MTHPAPDDLQEALAAANQEVWISDDLDQDDCTLSLKNTRTLYQAALAYAEAQRLKGRGEGMTDSTMPDVIWLEEVENSELRYSVIAGDVGMTKYIRADATCKQSLQVQPDEVREAIQALKDHACFIGGNNPPTPEQADIYRETLIRAAQSSKGVEWQPIETAPRGSHHGYILGINMNGKPPHSVFVMRDTFIPSEEFTHAAPGACWQPLYGEWPCYPTHWMPLPAPPRIVEEKQRDVENV